MIDPMQESTHKNAKTISKILVIISFLLVFTSWFISTPPGILGKADAIGYAVCHRIGARSFHIGDIQLPLCARCSGMYLGAAAGLAFQSITGWKKMKVPHWSILIALGLFVAAFGIDGANSYLALIREVSPGLLPGIPLLYTPNNTLRLVTGSGTGLAMAVMLFPAFNQTVWKDGVDQRVLPGWKAFGALVVIQAVLALLVLTGQPAVLYPLAVVSTLTVLMLLAMVYGMLWVMIMRRENQYEKPSQLWLPLLAGLTIAIIQIAAVDALRFWFTGTWGSFPLVK
jgi:uncharacterized membrane protein